MLYDNTPNVITFNHLPIPNFAGMFFKNTEFSPSKKADQLPDLPLSNIAFAHYARCLFSLLLRKL